MPGTPIRIANCSGFYGDRFSAPKEMIQGGPIDVLTGDYLAELTMLILWKTKERGRGFARTFLAQMEEVLGEAMEKGIKIVTNAGGLNPSGLADELEQLASRLGLSPTIAQVEGDDLTDELPLLLAEGFELAHLDTGASLKQAGIEAVTANAYLGGWGICEALKAGADIVVCPRVTDASLVVGPAAWHHGWARNDWDRLAGAVAAGHVIECGAQCTGGNYAFFEEISGLEHPGFPLAEVYEDGTSVITKHPGTGGAVTVGTVTAQLLYEIAGPRYANTDVVARFDTLSLTQEGPDRVRISGTRGEPAPNETKVAINYIGGYRNSMTFALTGLATEAKAKLVEEALFRRLGGKEVFAQVDIQLIGNPLPDPPSNPEVTRYLRITVKDPDRQKVGRNFSNAATELTLANYPGLYTTTPPQDGSMYGVYWPTLVPSTRVPHRVVLPGGKEITISPPPQEQAAEILPPSPEHPNLSPGPSRALPLGSLFGARSGDKGGNANLGIWARSPEAYVWLRDELSVARLKQLLPEAAPLEVERYELPNVLSLNFVIKGLLGEGVASSTRLDPQAKSLGEFFRAKVVQLPLALLGSSARKVS